jgi:predicted transcriptional regulator of viral defense system
MLINNFRLIDKLGRKLWFSVDDLALIAGIKPESARVLASRYAKAGLFVRMKNDFYILTQNWKNYSLEQNLKVANMLQVPSYISFATALSYYELTTQVPRGFYESAAQKRSVSFDAGGAVFNYYKMKRKYYFDFILRDGIFISTKEKAFIDAVYLCSLGRYKIDWAALDLCKLDRRQIRRIVTLFPDKTKRLVGKICRI